MNLEELLEQAALGEDCSRQFKEKINNIESLASEMCAFANTNGGAIFIGVKDDGTADGLSNDEVSNINQMISNAASQHIRSPLSVQT